MRRTRLFALSLFAAFSAMQSLSAQKSIVQKINDVGRFDNWCVREIKESGLIGGKTKYLYEFYGDQDTLVTGKNPF